MQRQQLTCLCCFACGCLADAWHERLVRYYSFFGFKPVCKVGGNGFADWPHLLVWGGEGTRMDADITTMLTKWTRVIRKQAMKEAVVEAAD
jgi:hypothetical protein